MLVALERPARKKDHIPFCVECRASKHTAIPIDKYGEKRLEAVKNVKWDQSRGSAASN